MAYDILKGGSTSVILVGPVILSSDHITGATGITLTVTISKNGAAFGSPAGAVTEISSGWYKIAGNATDSNTAGPIAVHATGAGCDPFDGVMVQVVDPTLAIYGVNVVQENQVSNSAITTIKAVQGLAVDGVVTTLTNLPAITANWLTAAGINAGALNGKGDWMVSYTQPTGFLAATFPSGTIANTTNITAGTMTTTTNLTNAATAGDFTATMKTSIGTVVTASAVASVTGNVGGNVTGNVTGSVGSVIGLTAANLDATVSSRLAAASVTVSGGIISSDAKKMNGTTINGTGTAGDLWRG